MVRPRVKRPHLIFNCVTVGVFGGNTLIASKTLAIVTSVVPSLVFHPAPRTLGGS
jgi:hypothetical protein